MNRIIIAEGRELRAKQKIGRGRKGCCGILGFCFRNKDFRIKHLKRGFQDLRIKRILF